MKLTESQAESFELLYVSVSNGLLYAEDLYKTMKEPMSPVITKLKWLKTFLEMRMPADNRSIARSEDHLFYDELLRCATHMGNDHKARLEKFINEEL